MSRQIIYFTLLIILILILNFVKIGLLDTGGFLDKENKFKMSILKNKENIHHYIGSGILILFIVVLFYILGLHKCESVSGYQMLDISPRKLCKGGDYMFQGNSPLAQMCKKMESTPEGRALIGSVTCGTRYAPVGSLIGYPINRWEYSPSMGECDRSYKVKEENVDNLGVF